MQTQTGSTTNQIFEEYEGAIRAELADDWLNASNPIQLLEAHREQIQTATVRALLRTTTLNLKETAVLVFALDGPEAPAFLRWVDAGRDTTAGEPVVPLRVPVAVVACDRPALVKRICRNVGRGGRRSVERHARECADSRHIPIYVYGTNDQYAYAGMAISAHAEALLNGMPRGAEA